MAATKAKCPRCGAGLRTDADKLICEGCGARGTIKPKTGAATGVKQEPPVDTPPTTIPALEFESSQPAAPPARRTARRLVLGGAAFFCLAGFVSTAYCFAVTLSSTPESVASAPRTSGEQPTEDWRVVLRELREEVARGHQTSGPGTLPEQPLPLSPEVKEAIDKGVAYLKKIKGAGGGGRFVGGIGASALAGLTLLECGVPADDPVVRKIHADVRKGGAALLATYEVAIVVWFLDRLGNPEDRELIKMLALRLIASQGHVGGWGYGCHYLSAQQENELMALLQQNRLVNVSEARLVARVGDPGRPDNPGTTPVRPAKPPVATRVAAPLGNLKDLPVFKFKPGQRITARASGHEDNSLTQFAILALWAVRKYDIPVERSLAMAEARFRTFQNKDGSWGYVVNTRGRRDSMTCAGLLGLAVARGLVKADNGAGGEVKDEALEKALIYVGQVVNKTNAATGGRGRGRIIGADALGDLYFLWSLERMAVVWDLKTVAGKDWYAWGSKLIVKAQHPDGSWADQFAGVPDTCFALLFLKRVNVVQDLTAQLKLLGKVKDPGNLPPAVQLPGEAVRPEEP